MKEIITTGLARTEMRTANKCELQNISQALATLSKRFHGLSIKEGNKGDGSNNKGRVDGKNGNKAVVMATTTPAEKITTKKTMSTAPMKSGYTQKAWNIIPHGPIRRDNGSKKSGTWHKKIEK